MGARAMQEMPNKGAAQFSLSRQHLTGNELVRESLGEGAEQRARDATDLEQEQQMQRVSTYMKIGAQDNLEGFWERGYVPPITKKLTNKHFSTTKKLKIRQKGLANAQGSADRLHALDSGIFRTTQNRVGNRKNKSGISEAHLCRQTGSVESVILEVMRVLKPGGFFLHVSFMQPEVVLPYLTLRSTAPWKVEVVKIVKPRVPFIIDGVDDDRFNDEDKHTKSKKTEVKQLKTSKKNAVIGRSQAPEYYLYFCALPHESIASIAGNDERLEFD